MEWPKRARTADWENGVPVSYTHLDVYKRQMRELAAKNLTGLANNWLSQDEENPRDPETDPITERCV